MSRAATTITGPAGEAAISGHLDTRTAAMEVAHRLADSIGRSCDLALMLGSFHHRAAFAKAAEIVRQSIEPRVLLGVTAESVLGVDRELEGLAGLTVLALRLPGVRLHPWSHVQGQPRVEFSDAGAVRELIGYDDELRATLMLADPFSTPITKLLPAMATCGGDRAVPVIGGLASGASQPGQNVVVLNDLTSAAGAVGVTISGNVNIDVVVSQGCRPIGPTMVVTKSKGNVIVELSGRKPIEVLQEFASELDEEEKKLLAKGLLCGLVINEYKDRFGRGDFLVRNVLGLDQKTGAIAVGDMPRVGQTIQFHVRDAATADEDLRLLLEAQVLDAPPFAAMLFTCNGRGERLFGEKHHDINIIRERLGDVPLAGFFAAGEIGPIGNESFVHGHTASLALFRGRG